MSTETHGHQPHFEALVEHIATHEAHTREEFAQLYGAPGSEPRTIAKHWCRHPDRFLSVLDEHLTDDMWFAVEQLAFEHDLPLDISWLAPTVRGELRRLGLLRIEPASPDETWVPAAMAVILAERLPGTRPTIPVLLGRSDDAQVEHLAQAYGVEQKSTRVETILAIAETFARPGMLDDMLSRLPDLGWLDTALMTLELGGVCYWQEVFGHEMSMDEEKVVPLMSNEDRSEQREVAEHLLDLGLIFRIEEDASEFAFIAVPEELWRGLWTFGQNQLLDWTAVGIDDLSETGTNGKKKSARMEPQAALKWLAVEAEAGRIETRDLMPTDETRKRLAQCSNAPARMWDALTCMGVELEMFDVGPHGKLRPTELAHDYLEESKGLFRTEVLHSWILGTTGAHCDVQLASAFGIDEEWRRALLSLLAQRGELPPAWLLEEGVPHEETGAGCLREIDGVNESLLLELGIVNAVLCGTKLRWLDLLSVLESERWYSVRGLVNLIELVAMFSLFAQIGYLIRDPGAAFYFPMQRPSLFTIRRHDDAFQEWVRDLATELLEPLGLGELSDDEEKLWLDTKKLRVGSTEFWPDEPRLQFVRDVFDDVNLDFDIANGQQSALRTVPVAVSEPDTLLATDLTLTELLQALDGASATSFDGKRIRRR
ncbi:MAG: hypothetical protein ACQEVA_08390 [Myxococcota bacterium]